MENAVSSLWQKFPLKTGHGWLNCLLLFVPVSVILYLLHLSPVRMLSATALAIAPMAGVLGECTSSLAAYAGPSVGGLLNASLGNATEFIIALFALHDGHIKVVKASLSGSIIGNLLLVLGLSIVVGGAKKDFLRFSRTTTSMHSTMLMIAVAALVMPAVFNLTVYGELRHENATIEHLSLWTSAILIALYCVNLIFVFWTHRELFQSIKQECCVPELSRRQALLSL